MGIDKNLTIPIPLSILHCSSDTYKKTLGRVDDVFLAVDSGQVSHWVAYLRECVCVLASHSPSVIPCVESVCAALRARLIWVLVCAWRLCVMCVSDFRCVSIQQCIIMFDYLLGYMCVCKCLCVCVCVCVCAHEWSLIKASYESFHETGTIWVPLTFLSVFYLLGHQNLLLKAFCVSWNVSFNRV